MNVKVSTRQLQIAAAVGSAAVAVWLAASDTWVFANAAPTLPDKPTFWQLLMSEHTTLGFVRLALILTALYAIVSVPALVTGGRWLKGFGSSGFTADDAVQADDTIEELKSQVEKLTAQRDRLERQLKRLMEA